MCVADAYNHKFESIEDFKKAGLPFFVCPGTSSWVSLFPRLPEAMGNIAGFAAAGKKFGAQGLLNTDWGDGGHYNFMEFSWHGFLFGAEQSWNTTARQEDFTQRFTRLFLSSNRKELAQALTLLGNISQIGISGLYQSIWQHLFFAPAYDPLFQKTTVLMASQVKQGRIAEAPIRLNASFGHKTLKQLASIRQSFANVLPGEDSQGVLPYWIFAVDTIAHAARKLTVLAPGGDDNLDARRILKDEMRGLKKRFKRLWLARNRTSEIDITLARYDHAIRTMNKAKAPPVLAPNSPWKSPYLTPWHVSRVVPRRKSFKQVPCATLSEKNLQWEALAANQSEHGFGFVNIHQITGQEDGTVYLITRLTVEEDNTWSLLVGHDGGVKVFIDGKAVLCQPIRDNPARPDRSRIDVTLTKGEHELAIAMDLDYGQGWGVFVAFEIPQDDRIARRKGRFPKVITAGA